MGRRRCIGASAARDKSTRTNREDRPAKSPNDVGGHGPKSPNDVGGRHEMWPTFVAKSPNDVGGRHGMWPTFVQEKSPRDAALAATSLHARVWLPTRRKR